MTSCAQAIRISGSPFGTSLVRLARPFPLMGHIAFGVIERGTNVIQVRPTTICFHDCIFCSVDAGKSSRFRASEYIVEDVSWLAEWVEDVARIKGGGVEALIDGVGEPISHPKIVELVRLLSSSDHIDRVALETHGGSLSPQLVRRLAEAGLDRINLSIDTLDPQKAKALTNSPWYDVARIKKVVELAVKETSIDVVLTPVVVPGINEADMKDLIEWARGLNLGSKSGWPSGVLIQKYEVHRYGRKVKGVKPWTWKKFYEYLRELEERTGYKLVLRPEEVGIRRAPRVSKPYVVGQKVSVEIVAPGWLKGELLGCDEDGLRSFTVVGFKRLSAEGYRALRKTVRSVIIRDSDNIYIARPA